MHFSTLTSTALATLPLAFADFHYGKSAWVVTTATGVYWDILPASQTGCYDAYHYEPQAAYGFTAPTMPLTVDICNTTITLDPVSGAWYTGSESAPVESGICDKLGVNGTGVASASCETAAFESRSIFTDLLSCSTDVCDGF
ncbi:unnamed protein product [Discula destructiva]